MTRPADVEIYPDASVKGHRTAWAVVIVRRDGVGGIVEDSGEIVLNVPDSFRAEAKAAAIGMGLACRMGLVRPGDKVVIRCDNRGVVDRFCAPGVGRKPLGKDVRNAFKLIHRDAERAECTVTMRHVKAHADLSKGDRHLVMNARADLLCCRALGTGRRRTAEIGVTDMQFAARSRIEEQKARMRRCADTVARLTGRM